MTWISTQVRALGVLVTLLWATLAPSALALTQGASVGSEACCCVAAATPVDLDCCDESVPRVTTSDPCGCDLAPVPPSHGAPAPGFLPLEGAESELDRRQAEASATPALTPGTGARPGAQPRAAERLSGRPPAPLARSLARLCVLRR